METTWLIGARDDCQIVVNQLQVSGHHARLTRTSGGYKVEDLNSTNGIYVNGARIACAAEVAPGDSVTLGLTTPMPWPPSASPAMAMVLRVGRVEDNDFVIDAPMVSSHHAEIVWEGRPGEATIRDLGSANGTAIGSPDRKIDRAVVMATDVVYLGTHAVPATHLLARLDRSLAPSLPFAGKPFVIGRDPSCDRVVDASTVSGRHARVSSGASGGVVVEDIGSSNGTFVNGRRIDGPVSVKAGDLISFGSLTMLLAVESRAVAVPELIPIVKKAPSPDVASPPLARSFLVVPAILVAVAPMMGLMIVAMANKAVAPTLGWLALAAVGFGLVDALCAGLVDARRLRSLTDPLTSARLGLMAGLCGLQCLLAWGIVAIGTGTAGPGPTSLAVMIVTALVGMSLGLVIVATGLPMAPARLAIPPILLALGLFGGDWQPYATMAPWARTVADMNPCRWAFEAMLVDESDRRSAGGTVADLAEPYFPADTMRSGLRTASMALGLILVGLATGAGLIAAGWLSEPEPEPELSEP